MIGHFAGAVLYSLTVLFLFAGCTTSSNRAGSQQLSQREIEFLEEEAGRVAHDFFVRGRYQEMIGHEKLALQSYLIAYQHDSLSRELCFFIGRKFTMRGEYEKAYVFAQKGLQLKGEARFSDFKLTADILLHLGKLKQAVVYYDSALAHEEDNRDVLYTLAAIYEQEGKFDEQARILEKLIPLVNYPEGLVDRAAKLYRKNGNFQALVDTYKKAWEATSLNLFGEKLAAVYASLDLHNHYLEIYKKLFRQDPDNYYYKVQIAQAFLVLNELDSAFSYYQELVKKFPEKEQFLFTFASLLFAKEKYRESKTYFLKLLSKNTENPQYHFYLGSIAEHLQDKELAELEFHKALSLGEENIDFWSKLGIFFLREEKFGKAAEVFAGMVKRHDQSPYAWYLYGVVYNQLADSLERKKALDVSNDKKQNLAVKYHKSAIEKFKRSLELKADDTRVLFELGVSLEKARQISQSIQTFKQLIQLDSTNSNALNYLGYMLVEQERELGTAITLINKALARDPQNGAFLDSKGWWYYKKKNYPKAREYIEKALEAGAQDVVILEHLALVLEKMGDMDSAREQWTLILKLDPNHKLANSRVN